MGKTACRSLRNHCPSDPDAPLPWPVDEPESPVPPPEPEVPSFDFLDPVPEPSSTEPLPEPCDESEPCPDPEVPDPPPVVSLCESVPFEFESVPDPEPFVVPDPPEVPEPLPEPFVDPVSPEVFPEFSEPCEDPEPALGELLGAVVDGVDGTSVDGVREGAGRRTEVDAQSRTTLSVPLPRVANVMTNAVMSTATSALTMEMIRAIFLRLRASGEVVSISGALTCAAPSSSIRTPWCTTASGSMVPSEATTRGALPSPTAGAPSTGAALTAVVSPMPSPTDGITDVSPTDRSSPAAPAIRAPVSPPVCAGAPEPV